MAEVVGILGLIGSIIGILDGVNKTAAIFKKYVHKSSSLRKELVPVLGKLTAFTGILRGLLLECELDESDSARLEIFKHIRAPLEASEKASKTIMARLDQVISISGISLAFGKVLNKETAAALHILEQTKDVLDLALDADQRTLLKAIEKYVRAVAEDLHDMLEQGKIHYKDVKDDLKNIQLNEEEARRAKAKADLLSWVSQVNYSSNYDAAQLRTCEKDQSGEWFLKSRNFRDWSKATSRFGLLVTGISGAGKTIMCSKAISHVLYSRSLNDGKANIVYFFFDFNDIAKQSVEGMVRSLIYQLVAKADSVPKTIQNLYSKHQSAPSISSPPRPEEWQKVLIALLQDAERPFVFIDALDECAESESQDLQETIQKLFKKGGAHAKWLLTARPSPRLLSFLQVSGFIHSSMEEGAINSDIELHLKARLENDAKLSSFGPKAKEMIISSITSKSAGMFRYAECQLGTVSNLKDRRVKKIREVLDKMPESLQSTYSQILHELHSSDNWLILERTLALVSYSARPVTIGEVAEFAILEDEMTTMQSEERFEDFGDILSLISSLIDVQDGRLTLAHKSVQEFLNAEPETRVSWWLKDSILYEGADLYIAKRCLQYLSFPQRPVCEYKEYRDVKNPNAKHLARLLSDYPLLDYAASRWTYHVRSEEVRNMVAKEIQNTVPLTAEPNLWKAWLLLQRADIWETRLQLARLLCEVSIRSAIVPGWACNLWKVRQAYRFTIYAQNVGHLDEKLPPKDHQGAGPSSSRILNEIRNTTGKQSQNGQWMILTTEGKSLHDLAVILLEVALQTNLYSDLDLILSNISSAKDLKVYLKDMLALSKYAATIMGKQYSAVVNECLSILEPATTSDEFRRANILELQDDAMEKFHAPLQSMLKSGFRASRGPVTARRRSKVQPTGSAPSASSHATAPTSSYAYYTSASTTGYGRSGTSASVYEYPASSTSGYGRTAMSATTSGYSTAPTLVYRSTMRPNTTDVVAISEPFPSIPKPYSEELPVLPGIGSTELPNMASLSSQSQRPPPAPVLPYWSSESETPPSAPALPSWSSESEPPPKFPQLHYVHETKQGTSTTLNIISSNLSTVIGTQEKIPESLEDPMFVSLNGSYSASDTMHQMCAGTDGTNTRYLKQQMHSSALSEHESVLQLGLPTIDRKRFDPSEFSTEQYKRCSEPWALSSIVVWIKDLAYYEVDLREHTIARALVALFTHKVPTINTADAETLGDRVVKEMFAAEALVKDEDCVKFGPGTMTGVLFQVTGSGCYSSRVHDRQLKGRCYSHQCMRTLKMVDLSLPVESEKASEDWATFYSIKKEDLVNHSKKEIVRQNILHEIVTSEVKYISNLNILRVLYRDTLVAYQPPIIQSKKLPTFIAEVFGNVEALRKVNEDYLLAQLKRRQIEKGPWIVGFSDIFREWIRKAKSVYLEYAAGFPRANYLVRRKAERNLLFKQFLDQAREDKRSNRLSWDAYLEFPITRLQRYGLLLQTTHKTMEKDSEEKLNLQHAINEIRTATSECNAKVAEMEKKMELLELSHKIRLRKGMEKEVELNLDHLGREVLVRGDLQRASRKGFQWVDTHAILFDHYLVLAKTVMTRDSAGAGKHEIYDASKMPIPMDLIVLESTDDDAMVESSLTGIGAVASTVAPRGQTNDPRLEPNAKDEKMMYPFRIKHLGKSEVYMLYAPSAPSRQEWCVAIIEAKTRRAASLYAQNAEPFRLRVLADSAFGYDGAASINRSIVIEGTPLDRAIKEAESKYDSQARPGPICRTAVNCATVFKQPYGRLMCAIGTDFGVYISEYENPRGWARAIQMNRVTQIAAFEEFDVFLLIADKSLIAYHLDAVYPIQGTGGPQNKDASIRKVHQKLYGAKDAGFFATGRMRDRTLVFYKKREGPPCIFQVLEPVLQKSTTRPRFQPSSILRGHVKFFKDYDEFYIPAECYTINLFHSSLAISTSRGVKVLTLDKKQSWTVPNLRSEQADTPAHLSSIASRIKDLKPLGMFRLGEAEFLVVFEECAVYVNEQGDISREVVIEFAGRAKSACRYGQYLILFDDDFVEIRNAMNGRMKQVITGKDIKMLDDGDGGNTAASNTSVDLKRGVNGLGVQGFGATQRTVKFCMQHPYYDKSHVVVELVEKAGPKE